jgi:hypothetical protein
VRQRANVAGCTDVGPRHVFDPHGFERPTQ